MVWRHRLLLAGLCWLLCCCSASSQTYNSADYVRNLYRSYLNREPSSNELTQWVWSFQKGLSLIEAQVTFLSSDEYFGRYARNGSSFVSGLFTDVLHRPPSTEESLQWLHRLNVSQGDRGKLVRDFLKAAEGHTSKTPTASTSSPPREPAAQEGLLVATASLLRGAIENEFGGTQQGRQLSVMSHNLVDASRSLEKSKQISPATFQYALANVQAAMTALEQQLGQVRYANQTSGLYLDRFKQVFASMGGSATGLEPLPVGERPAANAVGTELYREYNALSTSLLGDTSQVVFLLSNTTSQNTNSDQLLRDISFFQSQVDSVQQSVTVGAPKETLRHEVLRLRALSQGISREMQRTRQVGRVAQRWAIVVQDLQEIGELLGIAAGPAIDPGQPVLLNLPTYHQLPYQVQRPTAAQLSSRAIPVTDQAIAHIDAFVIGFNRFLPLSPRVPALQSQARGLRVLLAQFRQELATGTTLPQLQGRMTQINQAWQSVSTLWTRTVQERQLTNTPGLTGIAESIQNLNTIFQGN